MTEIRAELLKKIYALNFNPKEAKFTFEQRLSRENNWSLEYTERVVTEYKRFLFLAAEAKHGVSPSDEVDQVWHLHLLYTESYWDELCGQILKKPLHHGPTKGGKNEANKFHSWYSRTLETYTLFFGTPPADIWPPANVRFNPRSIYKRVNIGDYLLIPRKYITQATSLVASITLSLAVICCNLDSLNADAFRNPLTEYSGVEFLKFYVVLSLVGLCISYFFKNNLSDEGSSPRFLSTLPTAAVVAIGAWRFFIGLSRGKPVGYLAILCVLNSVAACYFLGLFSGGGGGPNGCSTDSSSSSSCGSSGCSGGSSGCGGCGGGGGGD